MRSSRRSVGSMPELAILAVILMLFTASTRAAAQQEKVLHSFSNNGTDGVGSVSALVVDANGNLYGTTASGGTGTGCGSGCGTVFELMRAAGGWTEKVLHEFTLNSGKDGAVPEAGLILDAAGNLYGTTYEGGAYDGGAVFELSPSAGGRWTEKILHSFKVHGRDGIYPWGGLIFDSSGNLYGPTAYGGAFQRGTVFELTPGAGGTWTEKLLHQFGGGSDGQVVYGGVVFDAAGNLYGTTVEGGLYAGGTVFELTPTTGGGWSEKVVHHFGSGADGSYPYDGVILDASGNVYGTTFYGGNNLNCSPSCGAVFELVPTGGGAWTEEVVHGFGDSATDGTWPTGGLIFDASGNLYGTTGYGGDFFRGTVFELTPSTGGWTETILHSFGNGQDGTDPWPSLVFDGSGNLYGTTTGGGIYRSGMAFEITP
jgi:uncharacterized repeat protein (TIGR03803 family)